MAFSWGGQLLPNEACCSTVDAVSSVVGRPGQSSRNHPVIAQTLQPSLCAHLGPILREDFWHILVQRQTKSEQEVRLISE